MQENTIHAQTPNPGPVAGSGVSIGRCAGCGRDDVGHEERTEGRAYTNDIGWHDRKVLVCRWCGTWTEWDTEIPRSVEEIVKYSQDHGGHFFDRDAMRGFGSRLAPDCEVQGSRAYFITSEQDRYGFGELGRAWAGRRLYTIRYMSAGGRIGEVKEFGAFGSLRAARKGLRDHLAEEMSAA